MRPLIAATAVSLTGCAGLSVPADPPRPEPCILERADSGAARPAASLADVAWLQGDWVGRALGGDVEETWGPRSAGAMLCMFRLIVDGAPVFYELVALAEADGSLELRVKHFDPDLTGWEEKDRVQTFSLVRYDGGTAWFDGITFQRVGDAAMRAWVRIHRRDGSTTDEPFDYRRRPRP